MIPSRTTLVPVAGITSTYSAPNNPSARLDVSKLPGIALLTPDTNRALHLLDQNVRVAGGTLFVSDLYRSWAIQAQAYEDWTAGKRLDYAAPPGSSFHMAGRAIDIDLNNLSFASPKSAWLERFWSLALPLGWRPIISQPNSSVSEAWHFQFLGADWTHLITEPMTDGQIAKCAILDAGQWRQNDPTLPILFLQAQCNRLCKGPGSLSVLRVDGELGPKTHAAICALLGPSWTVESATQRLTNL